MALRCPVTSWMNHRPPASRLNTREPEPTWSAPEASAQSTMAEPPGHPGIGTKRPGASSTYRPSSVPASSRPPASRWTLHTCAGTPFIGTGAKRLPSQRTTPFCVASSSRPLPSSVMSLTMDDGSPSFSPKRSKRSPSKRYTASAAHTQTNPSPSCSTQDMSWFSMPESVP